MFEKTATRLETRKGLYSLVLVMAFVLIVVWNLFHLVTDNKTPGDEWKGFTQSLKSEAEQLRSKTEVLEARLDEKKAEQDYRKKDRKLDFDAGIIARQQKEEDLRQADQTIAAMKSYVPDIKKGREQLDAVLTSDAGSLIARDDKLVEIFDQIYSQVPIGPEEVLWYLKEAQELREEIRNEDPAARGETRVAELDKLHRWTWDVQSSKNFYAQAQMQIEELVKEAQVNGAGNGPRITLAQALERIVHRNIHNRMFPRRLIATETATQTHYWQRSVCVLRQSYRLEGKGVTTNHDGTFRGTQPQDPKCGDEF